MLGIRDSHYSRPVSTINHVRFFIHSVRKTPNYLPWHIESFVPQMLSWREQSMCAITWEEKQTAVDRKDSNRGNTPIWRRGQKAHHPGHYSEDHGVKPLSILSRNSKHMRTMGCNLWFHCRCSTVMQRLGSLYFPQETGRNLVYSQGIQRKSAIQAYDLPKATPCSYNSICVATIRLFT